MTKVETIFFKPDDQNRSLMLRFLKLDFPTRWVNFERKNLQLDNFSTLPFFVSHNLELTKNLAKHPVSIGFRYHAKAGYFAHQEVVDRLSLRGRR